MSDATLPYFFFGTLMDADVLGVVLGRVVLDRELEPAILDGFERLRVRGERYPTLRPRPDGHLNGILISGLTAQEISRITFYEGEEYRLSEITLEVIGRGRQTVLTFMANVPFDADGVWDFASWQADEKIEHLAAARAFMGYFGLVDGAESSDARWREARRYALSISASATRR